MPASKRWNMPTTEFSRIWSERLTIEKAEPEDGKHSSWELFCFLLMDTFGKTNEGFDYPSHLDMSKKEAQYEFISERAYTKCKNIQRKLLKDKNKSVSLPRGWRDRNGTSKDRRTTDWDEIANMF